MQTLSWSLAALTALWFAYMAQRAGHNRYLWGFAGAVFGLVVSTLVLGVGQAAFIPKSSREMAAFQLRMLAYCIFCIGLLGWLLTGSVHRQHASLFGLLRRRAKKS